jgi:hypothetical protein
MSQNNTKQAVELLKKALALLGEGDSESAAVEMPSVKSVAKLDLAALKAVAASFSIEVDGLKEKAIRALITTAATVVEEGAEGEYTPEEVAALCSAVGLTVVKKAAANVTALAEYFETAKDAEDTDGEEDADEDSDEEEESDDDEDEKPKAKSKKAAADDDEDEDADEDDEEEAPAAKKKGKKSADDEEEDEDEDDEDEDEDKSDDDDDDEEDEKPAKKKKAKADADEDEDEEEESEDSDEEEESDDDEEEEVSPKEQAKRVAAYNKAKPAKLAKTYADVVKALKGNKWGEAYAVGDDGYCCGFPLKSAKVGKTPVGKCVVTGKTFAQNEDGELVEFSEESDD